MEVLSASVPIYVKEGPEVVDGLLRAALVSRKCSTD